jgi:hypothetical protein
MKVLGSLSAGASRHFKSVIGEALEKPRRQTQGFASHKVCRPVAMNTRLLADILHYVMGTSLKTSSTLHASN